MFKEDCAICYRLLEIQEKIDEIMNFIQLSCGKKGRMMDFGLYYSFLQSIMNEVRKAQSFHNDYHLREDQNPTSSGSSFSPNPDRIGGRRKRFKNK